MELKWTHKAHFDLTRLFDFLSPVNPGAAAQTIQSLVDAPTRFLAHPRIGEKLDEFSPREVRRILVGNYEMRYEINDKTIYVLRIWHAKENR